MPEGGTLNPLAAACSDEQLRQAHGEGPSSRNSFRVLICAERTLNATGPSRVTLSPQ